MEFEIINDKNKTVMRTETLSCIPDKEILSSMSKAGYRFTLNGKIMSSHKLNEHTQNISKTDRRE